MAEKAPTVSIALASYNGERYLAEQLESLASQTRPPDELIVSDDASTDATLTIVQEFAGTAPFEVRLLPESERLGYAGNFNRALLASSGDLVFPCDQDDVWLPEKLAVMSELAASHPSAMVLMNDVSIVDADLASGGVTKLEQFASAGIGVDRYVMGAAAAIRSEFLRAVLPIPSGYPAHDDWIIQFAIGTKRRHLHRAPLQLYRMHGSNTSSFRVNSTRRVSPLSVVRSRIEGLLSGRSLEIEPAMLGLIEQELWGAERAVRQSEGALADDFAALSLRLAEKKAVLERRLGLRVLPRLRRVGEVARMVKDGSYQQYQGLKSALADLMSPVAAGDAQNP